MKNKFEIYYNGNDTLFYLNNYYLFSTRNSENVNKINDLLFFNGIKLEKNKSQIISSDLFYLIFNNVSISKSASSLINKRIKENIK